MSAWDGVRDLLDALPVAVRGPYEVLGRTAVQFGAHTTDHAALDQAERGLLMAIRDALAAAEARANVDADTLTTAGWQLIDPNAFGERVWKPPVNQAVGRERDRRWAAERWSWWWKRAAKCARTECAAADARAGRAEARPVAAELIARCAAEADHVEAGANSRHADAYTEGRRDAADEIGRRIRALAARDVSPNAPHGDTSAAHATGGDTLGNSHPGPNSSQAGSSAERQPDHGNDPHQRGGGAYRSWQR